MSETTISSREIAMQRRKILGNGGKGSYSPTAIEKTEKQPLVESKLNKTITTTKTSSPSASKVAVKRDAVVQGGRAQSIAYRKASGQGKSAQKTFKAGGNIAAYAKVNSAGASSRDIAKKVRAEKCTRGKCGSSSAKKSVSATRGKSRNNISSDEVSSTLSGQNISGTRVGRNKVLTGANTGACKTVSGTEYLGSEEFAVCDNTPTPAKSKVGITSTNKGMTISGTEVGQSDTTTGNKSGNCAAITGSEYIPAEDSNFCGANSGKSTAKTGFSVMSPSQNTNSRKDITNSATNRAAQSTTIRSNPSHNTAPQKVVMSQTFKGNTTSGTQVGRLGSDVTGSDIGACQNVSGTAYMGSEEAQSCGTNFTDGATKVLVSGTSHGNVITGDRSGGDDGITGSEAGNCSAVTGTAYVGAENAQACDTNAKQEMQNRVAQKGNAVLSGTQTAPTGLTGAESGACQDVTGTETYSTEVMQQVCNTGANIGETNVVIKQAEATRITGDGWDRGDKVTGVGGVWSSTRNTSMRGAGSVISANTGANFVAENTEVAMSPITGSSGNTDTGAKVTLSGGARA